MPRANANGIELEYDVIGAVDGAPLLLVPGLGMQMIGWDDGFCQALVARGFRVIRYDNRDCGLSTKFEAAGPGDVAAAASGNAKPAYTLDDMAADAAGLLDALGIPAAHIVGASMGGFIAHRIALNHREQVLTLTSIMSGPTGVDTVPPAPAAIAALTLPPRATREERIEQEMFIRRALAGSLDPFDEAFERARATRMVDRSYYPQGFSRQFVAVLAAPTPLESLRSLQVPALVIHGLADQLIPPAAGRLIAAAIPGARLLEIERMGHELPKSVWPRVADAIAELARQAPIAC